MVWKPSIYSTRLLSRRLSATLMTPSGEAHDMLRPPWGGTWPSDLPEANSSSLTSKRQVRYLIEYNGKVLCLDA